jgi:hypothetical protein
VTARIAGENLQAFRGSAFRAARAGATLTLRPPQRPAANNPQIVSVTGLPTVGTPGVTMSADADEAYGDLIVDLGIGFNVNNPLVIVMRFPAGIPAAAQGLFVAATTGTVTQTALVPATDQQWSVAGIGALTSRIIAIHWEWNVSH